jgi:Zn-dependent protease
LACLFAYQYFNWPILLALSYTGFWLNLFNLIPILPLDGGRIVAGITPWLWIVGFVLMILVMVLFAFNPIVLFIVLGSIPRVYSFFKNKSGRVENGGTIVVDSYYDSSPKERIMMGAQYFSLAAALGFLMHSTHQQLLLLHPQ